MGPARLQACLTPEAIQPSTSLDPKASLHKFMWAYTDDAVAKSNVIEIGLSQESDFGNRRGDRGKIRRKGI